MILGGFLTAVGFVVIAAKISPSFLKKALGYDWILDLSFTLGIMFLFGSTGTVSGMMIAVITGLFISLTLFVTKKFWAYSKLEKVDGKYKWVDYPGEWTIAYMVAQLSKFIDSLPAKVSEASNAWGSDPKPSYGYNDVVLLKSA